MHQRFPTEFHAGSTMNTRCGAMMRCPHCEAPAAVADSRQVTRTVRDVYLRCTNLECGGAFKAQFAAIAMISPSATPHPDVILPTLPPRPRRQTVTHTRPANDCLPLAANDHQPGAAREA